MALRLGGLASGLDTESLVAQLMASERMPRFRMDAASQVAEARKTTLADIQAKLKALQTATADLRSPTLFSQTQLIESSDPSKVAFTRTGGVGTGAYSVKVAQVAAAEQRSYTYTAPGADTTITAGGHATAIPSGTTLTDAIAKINADADAKVWASDVNGKLALSWRQTGDLKNPDGTMSAAGVVTSDALSDETSLRSGRNAEVYVDGTKYTPATNELKDVPGLTLTFKAPTTTDVSITVGPPGADLEKVKTKLKAFVEAYNSANDLIRNELREEKVKNAGNRVDRGKGVVRGDPALTGLQARLRSVLSETIATGSTAADQLADLGISSGAAAGSTTFSREAVSGKLVLDEAKLAETLAKEPTRAAQLLKGIGEKLEAVLAPSAGADGDLDTRMKSADGEIARLKASMTRFDERLERKEAAYRAMFTRLEQGLSASNAQGSQLASQLAGLF